MRAKQTTPEGSVAPNRKAFKSTGGKGLPATQPHQTPIRSNVSTDDSDNVRESFPAISKTHLSRTDDNQISRLKTFKNSRPMFQEEEKYVKELTTYADCEGFKSWSPRGQKEDP